MERLGKHSSECCFTVCNSRITCTMTFLVNSTMLPSTIFPLCRCIWNMTSVYSRGQLTDVDVHHTLILICVVRWFHTGAAFAVVQNSKWTDLSIVLYQIHRSDRLWTDGCGLAIKLWNDRMWYKFCHNLFLASSRHSLERSGKIMSSLSDASQSAVFLRDMNIPISRTWPHAFVINDITC